MSLCVYLHLYVVADQPYICVSNNNDERREGQESERVE